ncbi:MAG: hypothetical protein JO272_13585 [Pseudonocardiales bacterium]|nr:hypothetical protein [Pseudonocardiales bacterium]
MSPAVREFLDSLVGDPSAVDDYVAARTPSHRMPPGIPQLGGSNHHVAHPPGRAPLDHQDQPQ